MGLLSHISKSEPASKTDDSTKKAPAKKAGSGLLARASKSTTKSFSSFQEWAKGNKFEHCGIFSCIRGMMVITQAYGIDSNTIACSVSSKDFWNGTLKSDETIFNYSKDDQDFYNFLQFFSFEMKNNISHITFVKLNNSDDLSVLMIFNVNSKAKIKISDTSINNIPVENKYINYEYTTENSKAIRQHEYQLLSINLSEIVQSSIKSIQLPEASIEQAVIECIYNEIFDLLKAAFPTPNYVSYRDDAVVKIALVFNENIDNQLLQSHITLLLDELLCKPGIDISLVDNGKTNDSEKIIEFLN